MFSENCSRSLGFRLRAYAVMKTYCKPYGPYAPLRYCPFTLASLLGRRKKGRGRGLEKSANGKRERSPSLPSLPNPPSPFSPSFQSPATFDACYPGYTRAYSAFGSLYQLLFIRSDTPTPLSFPTISSDPALWKS